MFNKTIVMRKSNHIINAAFIGALIGVVIGFMRNTDRPIVYIMIGALIGAVVAVNYRKRAGTTNHAKILLREEQLKIAKKRVKTGDVRVYKKSVEEVKNIAVPILREEVVIEKVTIDENRNDKQHEHIETVTIPISEEKIEIKKSPVVLEQVDVYNKIMTENKQIKETVKKEKENIKVKGNAKVKDKKS